jgi:hypothetical protein
MPLTRSQKQAARLIAAGAALIIGYAYIAGCEHLGTESGISFCRRISNPAKIRAYNTAYSIEKYRCNCSDDQGATPTWDPAAVNGMPIVNPPACQPKFGLPGTCTE